MDIKPIKTESDYNTALSEIEKLMGAEVDHRKRFIQTHATSVKNLDI